MIVRSNVFANKPLYALPVSLECGPRPSVRLERTVLPLADQDRVTSLSFHPNGQQLLIGGFISPASNGGPGFLTWLNTSTGAVLGTNDTTGPTGSATWRADGQQVVTAQADGNGLLTKVQPFEISTRTAGPVLNARGHAAFSPDGSKLALGQDDMQVRIVDARTGTVLKTIQVGEAAGLKVPSDIAWNPHGTRIAVIVNGTWLRVFDASTTEQLIDVINAGGWRVLWDPTGTRILTSGFESKMFDAQSGIEIDPLFARTIEDAMQRPRPLAWSPDGLLVLTQTLGRVVLQNSGTGAEVAVFDQLPYTSEATFQLAVGAWSADGKRFAFTNGGKNTYVYTVGP